MGKKKRTAPRARADSYKHTEVTSPLRPDVGTQAQFRKKKPPKTFRYDSSLAPALDWDGQNSAREQGESQLSLVSDELAQLRQIIAAAHNGQLTTDQLDSALKSLDAADDAARSLKALSRPFLNWAGKAERLSFDVPTLPLFVHERLSTQAILETLRGHRRSKETQLDLFADPQRSIADQFLRAYEHGPWTNRLILGDSLVVMNSLLGYESLGGQVQMIYMDPPYGVKFGSNFQPFVRRRDVKHGDDDDMTREPEMVQAYRDTWEMGLHSYLTYLRDRLLIARELLHPTGSIFVQISTENLHHVRELLDEVFGPENSVEVISFRKKTMPLGGTLLEGSCDYLLWYARDKERVKYHQMFRDSIVEGDSHWNYVELANGSRRPMTTDEINNHKLLPDGAVVYQLIGMYPTGLFDTGVYDFEFDGVTYRLPPGKCWKTPIEGMRRLAAAIRLQPYASGSTLRYILKISDYPVTPIDNVWADTSAPPDKQYVVQTSNLVVQRCLLMTTDPGDLVLDPTCGSGTTAYVAEQWGRRWITIDTSRVPLALARQRLLTATFPWYALKDEDRGPAAGFVYERKQNRKGEEVGGIVPHVTLKSIANNEPPAEEVLVDRPKDEPGVTRVTGPFCVEATIPTPVDWDADGQDDTTPALAEQHGTFVERMIEILRKSPVLRLEGNRTVTLKQVRPPARSLSLSAEAIVDSNGAAPRSAASGRPPEGGRDARGDNGTQRTTDNGPRTNPVAIVFGPENGAISERLVWEAAREAVAKSYTHLYVVGFMIQPNARALVDNCEQAVGVPATYVQATPDLLMGDLLKNMRSSQIFSVCGLPDVTIKKAKDGKYQVEVQGLDTFDPITMDVDHQAGGNLPAWFVDTDYNGLCFKVSQAFFPRTSAWDSLKRALRATHEEGVWDHLAGTVSAPFEPGEHKQVAVKVIDDRGNELLVVREL